MCVEVKCLSNSSILIFIIVHMYEWKWSSNIGGWVQDCNNSIANALELLQSYTKPSIYSGLLSDVRTINGVTKSFEKPWHNNLRVYEANLYQ